MARRVKGLTLAMLAIAVASAGCGDSESSTADETICLAIADIDAEATSEDAKRAVNTIKSAGKPADNVLAEVQDGVSAFSDQLGLPTADVESVAASCERVGVELDPLFKE